MPGLAGYGIWKDFADQESEVAGASVARLFGVKARYVPSRAKNLAVNGIRAGLYRRPGSSADMNAGAMAGVGHGSAQDFVGQRRSVAVPEKYEPKQIPDRISFCPSEINVRRAAGLLFEKNQQRRDGVRNCRTSRTQNRKSADSFAADTQAI